MEYVFNTLKDFIVDDLPQYLEELEDEETPLAAVPEKNVVFGAVDVSRYSGKVIVSVLPENSQEEESELDSWNESHTVTVTFLCSGFSYDVLVRQMVRYSAALRNALLNDCSMNGKVEDVAIGERKYFTDAGAVEKQMTAVEMELTIYTEQEIEA